jgi:cytochrome c-type biogenesis protein CcmE
MLTNKFSASGEEKILGHFVDGFCGETNTIYQFHGCFYHGCMKCYESDDYNTVVNETFYNLNQRTQRITNLFKTAGYEVVEMWECDYKQMTSINTYNPGQRTVMKALLNSLWGKLAQNEDTTVVSFIENMDDLLELVNDRSIEVTSLDFISDNIARTTHRKESCLTTLPNHNVIIACFVTAYACLELFNVLHKLGSNVLYYDTDSVIFIEDIAKGKTIKTGEYLGEMTDELYEKNTTEKWIEQFCTTGPKSYSYRTNEYIRTLDNGETKKEKDEVVRAKGFTLKGQAKEKMTFDSISACIKDKKKEIEIVYRDFVRENSQNIAVKKNTKKFKFTFDKRIIRNDFTTVPFGYILE